MVEGPELRALMSRLIDGPVETYSTKWIRVMSPGESTETHSVPLTQDFYRFQSLRRSQVYICWVPLGACPLSQGPLAVCSGSHSIDYTGPLLPYTEIPEQFYDLIDHSTWLSCDFRPGDVCVFSVRSLHASLK